LCLGLSVAGYGQSPPAPDAEIVTDRPDVTESSIVVPKGSLQFENGLSWTSDHGQTLLDLPETLVRFGISERTEFRFVVPNYLGGLTGTGSASGFGDIAVGMKQQIGPLPGDVDLSVILAVSLPTRLSNSRGPRILNRAGLSAAWNLCSGIHSTAVGI
jgi:hypothetical protein